MPARTIADVKEMGPSAVCSEADCIGSDNPLSAMACMAAIREAKARGIRGISCGAHARVASILAQEFGERGSYAFAQREEIDYAS